MIELFRPSGCASRIQLVWSSVRTGWECVADADCEQAAIISGPGVDGERVSYGSIGESTLVEPARGIGGFGSHREPCLREVRFVEVHRVLVAARGLEFRRVEVAARTRRGRREQGRPWWKRNSHVSFGRRSRWTKKILSVGVTLHRHPDRAQQPGHNQHRYDRSHSSSGQESCRCAEGKAKERLINRLRSIGLRALGPSRKCSLALRSLQSEPAVSCDGSFNARSAPSG